MTLLLLDRDSQYSLKATNQKGLKTTNVRVKEDGAVKTIHQDWKDHTFHKTNLGAGLDFTLIPQDPREWLEGM